MHYTANASRDGRFWLVHVPELDQWTQARTVKEIRVMATDLIELMAEVPAASIELDVHLEIPEGAQSHLRRSEELRKQAATANHEAAEESRRAARELKEQGLSVRDIGQLLQVSFQRAHQLVNS